MKLNIYFLVFILPTFFSFGQKYSVEIDSLTKVYFTQLPKSDQKVFRKIIKNRSKINFFERIDSAKFDYVFINESYCTSNNYIEVVERYFTRGDSLSDKIIVNGSIPKGFEKCMSDMDYFRLDSLYKSYNQLTWMQQLAYDKHQFWIHGCVVYENDKSKFTKEKTIELQHTYQIQMMIDKVHSKIIISFQTKPDNVTFETLSFNPLSRCW